MVTLVLPGVLRAEADGAAALEFPAADGTTLAAILDDVAVRFPRLERRLRDEQGGLRRYVNLYVDGEECRRLDGLRTYLADRAEILVVPSVAGG